MARWPGMLRPRITANRESFPPRDRCRGPGATASLAPAVRAYHSPVRFTHGPPRRARPRGVRPASIRSSGTAMRRAAGLWAAVHPPRPHIVQRPIPFSATRRAETAAYAKRHYGIDTWQPRAAQGHRRALHGGHDVRVGLRHVRRRRARLRAARASRHLRPLRDRHRRHHLPARPARHDLPPHGRPQLHRDRHRARRDERWRDPRERRPARRLADGSPPGSSGATGSSSGT